MIPSMRTVSTLSPVAVALFAACGGPSTTDDAGADAGPPAIGLVVDAATQRGSIGGILPM